MSKLWYWQATGPEHSHEGCFVTEVPGGQKAWREPFTGNGYGLFCGNTEADARSSFEAVNVRMGGTLTLTKISFKDTTNWIEDLADDK